uniref:Serine/threonine-protein phosphatase 2A regulatory subunit B'' subunit alpha/beta/delta EF-hand domain-containing protein n=1 Tax=Eptatretus burgeri TaxID=7764 RepID=A0A8C4WZX8_EPTBU
MASPAPATYARVATTVRHFCSVIVDHSILSSVHHCLEPCCSSHLPLGIKCRSRHRLITSQKLRKIDPFICGHAQPLAPFGSCSPEAGHSIAPPLPRKQHMSGHLAKVITGDAISLASGKIKEVVPEWVVAPLGTTAVSGSPVQFRKGRKVRPDTSSKCDTQLLELGDVQSPLRPKSNELNDSSPNDHPEEVELITDTSPTCKRSWDKELERTLSELFSPSAVETLVKRAYRREGIEACLRILLKCSEDLKCCTEIIHRCMQRKALAAGSETQGDKSDSFADIQCRDLVSHLAGCLRQLPTDFGDDGSHSNKPEALANLLESMYESASVSNLPPAYDAEHPPRYEDVVSRIASPSESSTSPISPMQITGDKLTVSEGIMSSSNDILHLKIEEDSSFFREGTRGCKQEEVTDHITFWENGVEVLPPSADKTSVIEAQGKMLEKVIEELSLEESADRFRSETQNGVCFAADATPENSATITHQSLSRHKKLDDSYVDLEHLIQDLENFSTELRNEAVNKFDASTTITSTITNSTALARCARQPLSITQDVPRDVEDDESLWQRILQSLENFQTDIVDHGCQTNGLQTQDHMAICQTSSSVGIGANVTDNTSAESVAPGTQLMVICQSPKVIKVFECQSMLLFIELLSFLSNVFMFSATTASIPRFYFPRGRPTSNGPSTDQAIDHIEKVFAEFPDERASIQNMGKVAKACGCPLYWKSAMFHAASGERTGFVSVHTFIAMWVLKTYNDDSSRFVALLARPGCNFLLQEDFIPLLQVTYGNLFCMVEHSVLSNSSIHSSLYENIINLFDLHGLRLMEELQCKWHTHTHADIYRRLQRWTLFQTSMGTWHCPMLL